MQHSAPKVSVSRRLFASHSRARRRRPTPIDRRPNPSEDERTQAKTNEASRIVAPARTTKPSKPWVPLVVPCRPSPSSSSRPAASPPPPSRGARVARRGATPARSRTRVSTSHLSLSLSLSRLTSLFLSLPRISKRRLELGLPQVRARLQVLAVQHVRSEEALRVRQGHGRRRR